MALLQFCQKRTQETLVLDDLSQDERFADDPYIRQHQPKSMLRLPVIYQRKLTGLLYLKNNLSPGAFTLDRLEVLRLLMAQVSISIENTKLYSDL